MSKFIVKCSFTKVMEDCTAKKVTEAYLIDAMSCTEAEARAVEELSCYYEDLEVSSVTEKKGVDVIGKEEHEDFFLAKVAIISLDERSGKEKKTVSTWYVRGDSFADAYKAVDLELAKSMADTEILSLSKTNIMEYYGEKNDA